jgi:hypothetical protein
MARSYFPPLKPIPEGATKEERIAMFNEYKKEAISMNPNAFNKDGTVKTTWQMIKGLFT